MSQQHHPPAEGSMSAGKDIQPILRGWEYEPGAISVRKVVGFDGQPKVQMRLDLGLLQMEMAGRPDGVKPNGHESLLDFQEARLADYQRRHGSEVGFELTGEECQAMRDEALQYYHRYLSLFVLGDYAGVARDTQRNLRVLDLCHQYAQEEQDRMVLEQYRPYIIMMNSRARASLRLAEGDYRRGLVIVKHALREIRRFFAKFDQESAYKHANEVRILKRFAREIRRHLPTDPLTKLRRQLRRAISDERYEEAARLRDEITRLSGAAPS